MYTSAKRRGAYRRASSSVSRVAWWGVVWRVAIDACVWRRAREPPEGVSESRAGARRAGKIEVVAGCGWGRRARVRPLHALGRAAGMLASQRSQSCNEEGAFFGARALRRPRGKGSGSPTC